MNVLVLAPHAFDGDTSAGLATRLLLRSLAELNHRVHVIAFAGGAEAEGPDIVVHEVGTAGWCRGLRPGFSPGRLLLNLLLGVRALRLVRREKPDVIHAIEEAVLVARILRAVTGVPYLYDMRSAMPDGLFDPVPRLRAWPGLLHRLVRRAVARALAVLPSCPALARVARDAYRPEHLIELRGVSMLAPLPDAPPAPLRRQLGVRGLMFLYAGGLERDEGIDLLLEGFSLHHKRRHDDALVVCSGPQELVENCRRRSAELHCNGSVHFVPPEPMAAAGPRLREADVLLSPRVRGRAVPARFFTYLDTGRPVLATRLYAHTQIVDDEQCMLCDPTPEQIAEGMRRLTASPALRERLAAEAHKLVQRHHSYPVYRATVESIYRFVAESRGGG